MHCIIYTALFIGASDAYLGYFDLAIIFDIFPSLITTLNLVGFGLATFLYFKGLYFPSTKDCGSSGQLLKDFVWGTELYPKVLGFDIKRIVNCRFSMTFWMLAGVSFAAKSYKVHGVIDWGLWLSAASQLLYLYKFFLWEIGYMRSIDIIVDRAGFEIQWGCLVFVPAIYTCHTRVTVLSPSGLSQPVAVALFVLSLLGVALNYAADIERQVFREKDGKCTLFFGGKPEFITAKYVVNGHTKTSLLLASGLWGPARHFHYVFELTAAWSWCLLANPIANPMAIIYGAFLTMLLLHRAKRDEEKCLAKYGEAFEKLMKRVPWRVIPGVY